MLELTLFFDLRAIKGARIVLFVAATGSYKPGREEHAPVAQRIERLTTDQKVGGSNPFGRTNTPSSAEQSEPGCFPCLGLPGSDGAAT